MAYNSRRFRLTIGVLFLIAIGARFIDTGLIYASAAPQPEAASSRVVPLEQHGRTIYVTPDESERLKPNHWSVLIIFALGIAAITLQVAADKKNPSGHA